MLALGASTWPVAWIGLELNLLGFVPIAILAITNFVVQSIGSLLLLYGGINIAAAIVTCFLGVLLKIGLTPLHFWVPPVASKLSPMGLGTLLSWQKLAPLSLLLFISLDFRATTFINLTLGAVMILSAACLSTLLIFRGLVQMAWVISLGGGSPIWHYLFLYYLSLWAVIWYQRRNTTPFAA